MKIKYSLEIIDMGDEMIAVPVGKSASQMKGVLKLNDSGKEICELLKEDTSEDAIIEQLEARYDNEQGSIRNYVRSFVESLRINGLLEE